MVSWQGRRRARPDGASSSGPVGRWDPDEAPPGAAPAGGDPLRRACTKGCAQKALVGTVYATIVEDEALARDVQAIARHLRVPEQRLADAISFAHGTDDAVAGEPPSARVALGLARDTSPSPARITAGTREACRNIEPAAIVEIITWLAVLQMLHRLNCYVGAT